MSLVEHSAAGGKISSLDDHDVRDTRSAIMGRGTPGRLEGEWV
jgi:hypothetical protein